MICFFSVLHFMVLDILLKEPLGIVNSVQSFYSIITMPGWVEVTRIVLRIVTKGFSDPCVPGRFAYKTMFESS